MHFFTFAQCFGYLAFVLGVAAFLQKDDRNLKLLIAAECLAYTVHFWQLGNLPASLSALVSAFRMLLAFKTRSRRVASVIIVVNILLGCLFAKTPLAWLPVVASCLGTVAAFRFQGIPMRFLFLICTFLWLTNNILCGSIGGTALESVLAIANIWTLIQLSKTPLRPIHAGQG